MRPFSLIGLEDRVWLENQARSSPSGCFVEVGVYKGGSAWHLYQVALEQERELFLYDTFTGVPSAALDDPHQAGDFSDTDIFEIRRTFPRARVVKGVFPNSIVPMPSIAFVHVDCDNYQPTRDCIEMLWPKVVPGGIMVFDDYPLLPATIRAVEEKFSQVLRSGVGRDKGYVVKEGENGLES